MPTTTIEKLNSRRVKLWAYERWCKGDAVWSGDIKKIIIVILAVLFLTGCFILYHSEEQEQLLHQHVDNVHDYGRKHVCNFNNKDVFINSAVLLTNDTREEYCKSMEEWITRYKSCMTGQIDIDRTVLSEKYDERKCD
jgi:hypothetical protein